VRVLLVPSRGSVGAGWAWVLSDTFLVIPPC
jgi:hypothetical protein